MCEQECKLNAVTEMVRCFADVVDAATAAQPGEGEDPVQVIAGLYQAKAAGEPFPLPKQNLEPGNQRFGPQERHQPL